MIEQSYNEVTLPELLDGAIPNNAYEGFLRDYYCLHCLLRKHQPKRFFEVGCSEGRGTQIIKNALGANSEVFSLELPEESIHQGLKSVSGFQMVGRVCTFPFTLLRGDSMSYDYSQHYPLDGWFLDSDHDFEHPYHEAKEALKSGAKIIVFHDMDSPNVTRAAEEALKEVDVENKYDFFRIRDTRIGYFLKK